MEAKKINLTGKVCPFPVVCIIREVDNMQKSDTLNFIVDDPLAIKSVPEELEDYEDITLQIEKQEKYWEILVTRSG